MQEFQYKPLQFEEFDNLFIGNKATSENAWVPTDDEPVPSKRPVQDHIEHDDQLEFMESIDTTILSNATDMVDEIGLIP